jgi:hypothetical protein
MNIRSVFTLLVVLALAMMIALTVRVVIGTPAVVSSEEALKIVDEGGPVPPDTEDPQTDNSPAIRLLAGTYTNASRTAAIQISSDGVITWTSRLDRAGTRYTFTQAGDTLLVIQPRCVTDGSRAGVLRASYRWALVGSTLTLSPISDTCERRRHDLASVVWIKKTIWLV